MERLRARWWAPLIGVAGFSVAILLLAPRYTDAQVAGTAAVFRDAVADVGNGRTIAAALADMLFVVAYFTLALALSRNNKVSRVGLGVMTVAAGSDMVENTLVILGVAKGDRVTDGFVDAIRAVGAVKWTGVLVGGVVVLAGLFVDRRTPV